MYKFDLRISPWKDHSPQRSLFVSNRKKNPLLLTIHSAHYFPKGGEMIINHRALLAQVLVEPLCKESWIFIKELGQVAGELAWVHGRETKGDGITSSFDNFKTNLFANPHWAMSEDIVDIVVK